MWLSNNRRFESNTKSKEVSNEILVAFIHPLLLLWVKFKADYFSSPQCWALHLTIEAFFGLALRDVKTGTNTSSVVQKFLSCIELGASDHFMLVSEYHRPSTWIKGIFRSWDYRYLHRNKCRYFTKCCKSLNPTFLVHESWKMLKYLWKYIFIIINLALTHWYATTK